MWRQSMHRKWIEPSTLASAIFWNAAVKKAVNAFVDISPEAIAKSRWLAVLDLLTLPTIGTLYGGSLKIMRAASPSIRAAMTAPSRASPHTNRCRPQLPNVAALDCWRSCKPSRQTIIPRISGILWLLVFDEQVNFRDRKSGHANIDVDVAIQEKTPTLPPE